MSDFDTDGPEVAATHGEPVLVLDAGSQEEADIAVATLTSAGIHAFLFNPNPSAGAGRMSEPIPNTWANGVFVAPEDAEAANAILNADAPTEEELTAEEEADPTTLAEAEAAVKNA